MTDRLFEAIAEFDFQAEYKDELTLRKGNRLFVTKTEDEVGNGWFAGEFNGKVGLFPSNFVKRIDSPAAPAAAPSISNATNVFNEHRQALVMDDYEAADMNELDLNKGDSVVIFSDIYNGWCLGECNGRVGAFPYSFVKEIDSVIVEFDYQAQNENELTLRKGTRLFMTKTEAEVGKGWCEGKLDGKIGLFPSNFVKRVGLSPAASAVPSSSSSSFSSSSPSSSSSNITNMAGNGRRLVWVVSDYKAADMDELDLNKGDLVVVSCDVSEGWCQGECNGRVGLFPLNFVKEVHSELQQAPAKEELNTVLSKSGEPVLYLFRAKANFDYPASSADELSLHKNEEIYILSKVDDDWYIGYSPSADREGVFPCNFVEKTSDSNPQLNYSLRPTPSETSMRLTTLTNSNQSVITHTMPQSLRPVTSLSFTELLSSPHISSSASQPSSHIAASSPRRMTSSSRTMTASPRTMTASLRTMTASPRAVTASPRADTASPRTSLSSIGSTASSIVHEETECAVCLETIQRAAVTACGHMFCQNCINQVVQFQKKCPLCRKKLSLKQVHHR